MKPNIEEINWQRIEQGLSLTELAKKSQISNATVNRLMNNCTNTRPSTIGKIARALGVPPQELFIKEQT